MVRAKAVSEAVRVPRAAGEGRDGPPDGWEGEEMAERSLRIVVRCLSAELKVVFWWWRSLVERGCRGGVLEERRLGLPCWGL